MWLLWLLPLLVVVASWAMTCTLIFLICLCFSWEFNLVAATGVWLALAIARSVFSGTKEGK